MTHDEYLDTLHLCHTIRHMAQGLDRLDAAIRRADIASTLGPILDPTLWMKKCKVLDEDIEVMRAVQTLRNATRVAEGAKKP